MTEIELGKKIYKMYAEIVRKLQKETGLTQQEATDKLLELIKSEIEDELNTNNPLNEKVKALEEELIKQKQTTADVIKLAEEQRQDLVNSYEHKKISKTVYLTLKELERIEPKALTQTHKDIMQLYEKQTEKK